MDGVFWHNDIGYVVDIHHMPSSFPDGVHFGPVVLDDMLRKSNGFPDLVTAPVASWLIARLSFLSRERLAFETKSKLYNDGGGFYVNLIAFTRELQPFAFFLIHGTSENCRCWGECLRSEEPMNLISAFADLLTSEPMALMECHLTAVDTDPPDLVKRRFGTPYSLGWDGTKFLGATESA